MADVKTTALTISIESETALQLTALATARNGSLHNCANEAIRAGVAEILSSAPGALSLRYSLVLTILRESDK